VSVRVELFGIPRERAGVSEATAEGDRLSDVLSDLATRFPRLAETCFNGARLQAGYVANLNGNRFISDPSAAIAPGDVLLILSADAGG